MRQQCTAVAVVAAAVLVVRTVEHLRPRGKVNPSKQHICHAEQHCECCVCHVEREPVKEREREGERVLVEGKQRGGGRERECPVESEPVNGQFSHHKHQVEVMHNE